MLALASMMGGNASQARMANVASANERLDGLTPAEAKAYMQQLSVQLKDWQHNLDRLSTHRSSVRNKRDQVS